MSENWSSNRNSTGLACVNSLRKLMIFNSLNEVGGVTSSLSSTPDSYYSAYSPVVATTSPAPYFTPCSEHFDSTGSSINSNHSSPIEQKCEDEELYKEESTIETVTEHVVRPSLIKQLSRTHSLQTDTSTAELLEISAAFSSPSRDVKDASINKRLKLKTVGKLLLPATFMDNNDRNNNCQVYNNNKNNYSEQTLKIINEMEEVNKPNVQKRTIGKIKSIFLDVCEQQAKLKDNQTHFEQAVNQFVLRRKPLERNTAAYKLRAVSYHGTEDSSNNFSEERSSLKQKYVNNFISSRKEIIENSTVNISMMPVSTKDAINRNLINARALAQQQCNGTSNSVQSKYAKYFIAAQLQTMSQMSYKKQIAVCDKPNMQESRRSYGKHSPVKNFHELLDHLNITEQDLKSADAGFHEIFINL